MKPKFFNIVVCNPCQSSPSLTILVPLWLIIISLVFFYLSKALFSGFLQFKGNFVDGRNNSKYRDVAPLKSLGVFSIANTDTRKNVFVAYKLYSMQRKLEVQVARAVDVFNCLISFASLFL